jgi:hypothetical protein
MSQRDVPPQFSSLDKEFMADIEGTGFWLSSDGREGPLSIYSEPGADFSETPLSVPAFSEKEVA